MQDTLKCMYIYLFFITGCLMANCLFFKPLPESGSIICSGYIGSYSKLKIQCNLDLVTLNLVITCDLVTILQRPVYNLLHKIIRFSDSF